MTVCYWCGSKDTLADVGKELDDGKYKMVQCSKCKNAYYVVNKEKMNKQKPQNNEEWIKQANTEQLAEWIAHQTMIALLENQNNHSLRMTYPAYWVEWLKQPHHESVTNCNK